MKMDNSKNSNNALRFIGGLALGVAVGYFFNSNKGKLIVSATTSPRDAVQDHLEDKAADVKDIVKATPRDAMDAIQRELQSSSEKAKKLVNKISTQAQSAIDKAVSEGKEILTSMN